MTNKLFSNAADIHDYTLAGRAVLTLTSEATGAHYTYRIAQAKDQRTGEPQPRWFVALLTGPDNTADYSYMGMLDTVGEAVTFRLTKGSKFAADGKPVRAFAYFWKFVAAGQTAPQLEVRHEGRCGRCGRVLTVDSSIDSGIGPECLKKMEA